MAISVVRYEIEDWGVGELWAAAGRLVWHELPRPLGPPRQSAAPPGEARRRASGGGRLRPSHFEPTVEGATHGRRIRVGSVTIDELVQRLHGYFRGGSPRFDDVELDLEDATPFQHALAQTLRSIPHGAMVTYGELAALAGRPGAQRAAGSFCARNRVPLIVPCHRVVAAGGLGAYGSLGTDYKRRLLELEGAL